MAGIGVPAQGSGARRWPRAAAELAERWGRGLADAPVFRQRIVLALVAFALFLPGLATLPVTDRDEARFAQASREMVATGDPIDIRFQGQPRYNKPVGIYWLQSAAMLISGQGAEAPLWVQRLPSLFGAVAAVVLVQAVGLPLVGAPAAALAALVFAASLVLAGEARIAKTDAVLLALTLGAMAVLVRAWLRDKLAVWQVCAFWACLAGAALVKGPVGPLVVGLTALTASLVIRDAGWLRPLARRWPIALGAAILLPWLVAISLKSGAGFWNASVGADLLAKVAEGQEGKGAPPGTYLALVWLTFWPGSLLLAFGLPAIWAARREPGILLLLCWLVPAWLLLELVPTKLVHYPLPLYPALALLALAAWQRQGPPAGPVRYLALPFLAPGPVLLLAAAWGVVTTGAPEGAWPALVALPLVAALAVLAWVALSARLAHALPLLLTMMAGLTSVAVIGTLARTPHLWPSEQLARLMLDAAPPGCAATSLIAVGYSEPSLVLNTAGRVALFPVAEAAQRLAEGCAIAAVEDRVATDFARATAGLDLQAAGRVEGFAIGAGRSMGLNLYLAGANR